MDLDDGPYQIEVEPVEDLSPSSSEKIREMLETTSEKAEELLETASEKGSELNEEYDLKEIGMYAVPALLVPAAARIGEEAEKRYAR